MNSMKSASMSKQYNGDVTSDCICERPKTNLICLNCHRSLYGRVHKMCEQHPTVSTFRSNGFSVLQFDDCVCFLLSFAAGLPTRYGKVSLWRKNHRKIRGIDCTGAKWAAASIASIQPLTISPFSHEMPSF